MQTLRYCVFFPSPQKKTTSDSAEAEAAESNQASSQDVDEGFDEADGSLSESMDLAAAADATQDGE